MSTSANMTIANGLCLVIARKYKDWRGQKTGRKHGCVTPNLPTNVTPTNIA